LIVDLQGILEAAVHDEPVEGNDRGERLVTPEARSGAWITRSSRSGAPCPLHVRRGGSRDSGRSTSHVRRRSRM
jgi:hypothetical protein